MQSLLGIDEVGRGSWAGPLVAGAVTLNKKVKGLKDSKLLSPNQRVYINRLIYQSGVVGLGWVSEKEIDQIGLSAAVKLAMERAFEQIKVPIKRIIVDGNINYLSSDNRALALIKADQTVSEVSAASIVAKVARDDFMRAQAKLFPNYFFDRHFGYGTLLHRQMLEKHGVCDIHRLSYKPVGLISSVNKLAAR